MLRHLLYAIALFLLLTTVRAQPVTVRLVGGSDPRTGRLEVYHNGVWGTVCNDYFTNAAARVVCYMLGYGRTGRYIGYHYGGGDGTIWLDNVQCSGLETNIADCPHSSWGKNKCSHYEDVSVSCIPDSAEAVALVGGGNPRVGRLEVFHGTQWGTVCDDGFTDAAARVVCYSLGFGYVGRKVDIDRYGVGDGLIWLNNVVCKGTEQYIGECSLGGWRPQNCSHQQDVAVSCTNSTSVTPVRLVGGSRSTGRLEVLHDGVWGTVCRDFFAPAAATVVCSMLGFGSGTTISNHHYTTSHGPIWLDNVRCNGTETDIAECSHGGWGVHDCQHHEAVAVSCAPTKVEVRLNGGRDPREGRLEVLHDGAWRSVCGAGFNHVAATVVCNMLGFGHVGRPTRNNYGDGPGPLLQSVQCNGTEKSIVECADNDWSLGNCSSGEEQAVSCLTDNAVALFGSGHPRKGRLEVYHNGTWGTVCDDYFKYAAARVVCHTLGFGYIGRKKNAINYGLGTGIIWLDRVRCEGTESHIGECSHGEWGDHDCGHDEDIAVVCFGNWSETSCCDDDDDHFIEIYFGTLYPGMILLIIISVVICCCRGLRGQAAGGRVPIPDDADVPTAPAGIVPTASASEQFAVDVVEPPPRYDQVELPPRYDSIEAPPKYESSPRNQAVQRF